MDEWLNSMLEQQRELLKKYGYVLHFVFDDTDCPNNTNFHSHGLMDSYGHPDFQLCFPLQKDVAESIFSILVEKVMAGQKFEENIDYSEVLGNGYLLRFTRAMNAGQPVLRLLIPDKDGSLSRGAYLAQLSKTGL